MNPDHSTPCVSVNPIFVPEPVTIPRDLIDRDEYPRTAEPEIRCVRILAGPWHAPDGAPAPGQWPDKPGAARPSPLDRRGSAGQAH